MMKRVILAMTMACALALGGCMAGNKAPADFLFVPFPVISRFIPEKSKPLKGAFAF